MQNVYQFLGISLLGRQGLLLGPDAHILDGMKRADFSRHQSSRQASSL